MPQGYLDLAAKLVKAAAALLELLEIWRRLT